MDRRRFRGGGDGQLPMGKHTAEWAFGDVEAGFKEAALVLDETLVGQNTSHQPLETALGDGLLAERQAVPALLARRARCRPSAPIARWVGIPEPRRRTVVLISEYTGGGFGSKHPGLHRDGDSGAARRRRPTRRCMMRITREDEHYIGRARPALHSRVKVGFAQGRPHHRDRPLRRRRQRSVRSGQGDGRIGRRRHLARAISRRRCGGAASTVLTNTPPRGAQRAPGGMQGNGADGADPRARPRDKLGIDQVEIRKINAPAGKAPFGAPAGARPAAATSRAPSSRKRSTRARRSSTGRRRRRAAASASARRCAAPVWRSAPTRPARPGFDGLLIIRPDGKVQIQSGIGNLGTHSVIDVHRVAADILGVPWEQCEVVWGNTSKNLPWTLLSGGSQTVHAMTRAAHAVGTDGEEAAAGNRGEDARRQSRPAIRWPNGRVVGRRPQHDLRAGGAESDRARRQVRRPRSAGGHQRLHEDVDDGARRPGPDRRGARQLSARRPVAVLRRRLRRSRSRRRDRRVPRSSTSRRSPTSARSSTRAACRVRPSAASMLGIGHAIGQKWVYDQHYGVPLAKRFHHNKPPTILDAPRDVHVRGARHSRSGNAGRRARHRRAAGRRRLRRGAERDCGGGRRRGVPARCR